MGRRNGTPIDLYGTEKDLFGLLKKRYPAPSWACIPQVANGTGSIARRWADAVALCCWPSMGMELHGFEMKTHRSDWLRELEDGSKSQEVWQFCDRWWVLAATKDIVGPGELPKTWGLLVPRGGKLYAEVAAPELQPKALTKTFIASILRNAMEVAVPDALLKEEFQRGRAEGLEDGAAREEIASKADKKRIQALEAAIAAFEKTSGLKFPYVCEYSSHFTDHETFGAAVRLVLAGKDGKVVADLLSLRDEARRFADLVEKQLTEAREATVAT